MEHQRLTNKEVKKKNRNQIFRYICTHGTVSNPDIVSDLHLSLPTVTNTTRAVHRWPQSQSAVCRFGLSVFHRTGYHPKSSWHPPFESDRRHYKI